MEYYTNVYVQTNETDWYSLKNSKKNVHPINMANESAFYVVLWNRKLCRTVQ